MHLLVFVVWIQILVKYNTVIESKLCSFASLWKVPTFECSFSFVWDVDLFNIRILLGYIRQALEHLLNHCFVFINFSKLGILLCRRTRNARKVKDNAINLFNVFKHFWWGLKISGVYTMMNGSIEIHAVFNRGNILLSIGLIQLLLSQEGCCNKFKACQLFGKRQWEWKITISQSHYSLLTVIQACIFLS